MDSNILSHPEQTLSADHVVIGSGPGGAITAALLAEAGKQTLMVEQGPYSPLDEIKAFSIEEMECKYRNGGITTTLGAPKTTYVEGACAGGGSEINSGLYYRTPSDVLQHWSGTYQLRDASSQEMLSHFEQAERDTHVTTMPPDQLPKASLKLKEGADALNWQCAEVPRWVRYDTPTPTRQTMTQTYIPRFLSAGGQFLPDARVLQIQKGKDIWVVTVRHLHGGIIRIKANHLFLSAGAIHTPTLLLQNRLAPSAGQTFRIHPTVKAVALFDEVVNRIDMGVPVHQVKHFSPKFSFGCSISRPEYLSLTMTDHPGFIHLIETHWQKMAVYYAMTSTGTGRIRILPFHRDPLVQYHYTPEDLTILSEALTMLCKNLLAAGAKTVFPSVQHLGPIQNEKDLEKIPLMLSKRQTHLMTIHLFSSCPMGENKNLCTVDSYGNVFGQKNLHIHDASILPTPPGVNPQGSVMAFAIRNTLKFLSESS